MEKIKILCDSTGDIPRKFRDAREDLEVLPVHVTIDGRHFLDWEDYDMPEFFRMMRESEEIPTTAQVSPEEFKSAYLRAAREGYTHIATVTINERASGTFQSAQIAKALFFEEYPDERVVIENIDSTTYSVMTGMPVMRALCAIDEGEKFENIVRSIHDEGFALEAVIVPDTLKYLQKTGRVSRVSGTIGEVLQIKPLLRVGHGEVALSSTVRGKKHVIPAILEHVRENIADGESELFIVSGDCEEDALLLLSAAKEEFPSFRIERLTMGSAIIINTGPDVIGIVFKRKL